MDTNSFDALARLLANAPSRRTILGLSLAGALGALLGGLDAEAKKKRKKKKKKRKKKPCIPSCAGKACGSNGCGGSCGPCEGGECQNGECVCPFSSQCSPGVCCANGQFCHDDGCGACPVGPSPCEASSFICGVNPSGNPCVCVTTIEGGSACIGGRELIKPFYCADCDSDADCEALLGLPAGQAVCVGGVDCGPNCDEGQLTVCAVNGCVDVEFCDTNEECSAGTCINHRCQ